MSFYQEILLENKMKIIAYPLRHLHSIEAALYFRAGPLYEEEYQHGISHLLQHMCLRDLNGILKQELVASLDDIGTTLEGNIFPDAIVFNMRFAPRFFDKALSILSHFFVPSKWFKKEVSDEKAVVLRQIENKDPDFWTDVHEHYWRTSENFNPIRGSIESVSDITTDILNEFKEHIIQPSNACLILTGNFSSGMVETAKELLSRWPGRNVFDFEQPVPFNFCYRDSKNDMLIENRTHKAHVQLSFDINDDMLFPICVDILNNIVGQGPGSAMYVALRDQQALTDEVTSFVEQVGRFRRMIIEFSLPNASLLQGLRAVINVVLKLSQHISMRKLGRTSVYFNENLKFILDNVHEMNRRLGWGHLSGRFDECEIETLEYMYKDVTTGDMLETAQTIFRSENLCFYISYDPTIVPKSSLKYELEEQRNRLK